MGVMEHKRTLTMNWDGCGDDDDDDFFDTYNRGSAVARSDLVSSDSDEEDFEDSRMSFASAAVIRSGDPPRTSSVGMAPNYDIWMAAPGSVRERRKRLFAGMGLDSDKELHKANSINFSRNITKMLSTKTLLPPEELRASKAESESRSDANSSSPPPSQESENQKQAGSQSPLAPTEIVRSRSEGDIDEEVCLAAKQRREDLIGAESKQRLQRTYSEISTTTQAPIVEPIQVLATSPTKPPSGEEESLSSVRSNGAVLLIKNLDTGKEFVVKESEKNGMWHKFSDIQTGNKLTEEEFEKCVGFSPVVKELMRRQNKSQDFGGSFRKFAKTSSLSKSIKTSKRRGATLLKNISTNIKGSMKGAKEKEKVKEKEKEKEKEQKAKEKEMEKEQKAKEKEMEKDQKAKEKEMEKDQKAKEKEMEKDQKVKEKEKEKDLKEKEKEKEGSKSNASTQWIKVRQAGKSHKDLSALHLCQEIQAHEGSIWTMKFTPDGQYLASAGEDKTIHVWEVQECEVMSSRLPEEGISTPLHPTAASSPVHPSLADAQKMPSTKQKKIKSGSMKKRNLIPDYAQVPETVFALSEKPICSFDGHTDDVLDLSWSKSQLLISSSMDKTVKLWNLETKNCLKTFSHNDYVTCIHFNPVDDNFFISGSLDEKVRIWNIRERRLETYNEIYEMVTAVCYSPDGQEAIIGTHKGNCRLYAADDSKLEEKIFYETQKKSQAKKITGFQFVPGNPSEVLVTTADSRIRIFNGDRVVHKFKGFKNTSSQIVASFSKEGKYVMSPSEDSQVYFWKREVPRHPVVGKGKTRIKTKAHEHFICKDVSVAIPWPGSVKGEPASLAEGFSKKHSKRSFHLTRNITDSPKREGHSPSNTGKGKLPPLPKKGGGSKEHTETASEDEASADMVSRQVSRSGSGIGESFNSDSSSDASGRFELPSFLSKGGSRGSGDRVTAWGLVIVTASLGGEIRAYQNFGLPRRLGRF